MFILAMAMYGVRYIGYSYITCPWFAFPFEALEVFTLNLFMVAVATYVKVILLGSKQMVSCRFPSLSSD